MARANAASTSGTYRCSELAVPPSVCGDTEPHCGISSEIMKAESAICSSACITLPSGMSIRWRMAAPNARW